MAEKKTDRLAGLIPYRVTKDGEIKMLFMRPEEPNPNYNRGDKYEVAKGWVDEGEDLKEAAMREATEELGLFKGNIIKTEELGTFPIKLTVFVAKVKDKDLFGDYDDDEVDKTKWMTAEDFDTKGIVLQRVIVQSALRKIRKLEGLTDK